MDAYRDFAEVYDIFMDETPYEEWAGLIGDLIEKYGVSKPIRTAVKKADAPGGKDDEALLSERNLVLDLGCGTGTLTELLYEKGYDMMGIDNSEEMLQIAMNKKEQSGSEILYLCQDMRELDLYSTVGTVISVCDSVNYLLQDEEMEETFSLVNNYLYPGGIFIFDFNTLYKYENIIGDTTIAENRDECSFIWENFYHEKEHINEYDLTIFVRDEKEKSLFRRFCETHYQRGYTLGEMERFIKNAGMELVLALDGDTHKAPTAESERIYIVCRRQKK